MIEVATAGTDEARAGRNLALAPYLELLQHWSGRSGDGAGDTAFCLGEARVAMEPFERDELVRWLERGEESSRRPALGLALLVKIEVDLGALRGAGREKIVEFYTAQAELMLDTAIGIAVRDDLQREIDTLVADGATRRARSCSRIRQRVAQSVAAVAQVIEDSEFSRAQELAGGFRETADPVAHPDSRHDVHVAAPAPHGHPAVRRARRERAAVTSPGGAIERRPPTRTKLLCGCVAFAALLWAAAVQLPRTWRRAAPSIAVVELAHPDVFEAVLARPPALYVTVRREVWAAAEPPVRREWIETAARAATRKGYRGLLFRTHEGIAVGRWFPVRGVELIEGGD